MFRFYSIFCLFVLYFVVCCLLQSLSLSLFLSLTHSPTTRGTLEAHRQTQFPLNLKSSRDYQNLFKYPLLARKHTIYHDNSMGIIGCTGSAQWGEREEKFSCCDYYILLFPQTFGGTTFTCTKSCSIKKGAQKINTHSHKHTLNNIIWHTGEGLSASPSVVFFAFFHSLSLALSLFYTFTLRARAPLMIMQNLCFTVKFSNCRSAKEENINVKLSF